MPVRERRVYYFAVRATQASKSSRYEYEHGYRYRDAVEGLAKGMTQEHYSHANENQDPELFAYTKISDLKRSGGGTLVLVERGERDRPAPMIGTHHAGVPATHVQIGGAQMEAFSCHVLLSHTEQPDGTFVALIEGVPFVSKTTIQNFLNHLFFGDDRCRLQHDDGYMVYFKLSMDALTDYSLSDFLNRDDVDADFELLLPDARLDNNLDEVFELTYRKRQKTNYFRDRIQNIWNLALQRTNMKVRIRAKHGGEEFTSEFRPLVEDYAEFRLGHSATIEYAPPLDTHHAEIHPDVSEELYDLLERAEQ